MERWTTLNGCPHVRSHLPKQLAFRAAVSLDAVSHDQHSVQLTGHSFETARPRAELLRVVAARGNWLVRGRSGPSEAELVRVGSTIGGDDGMSYREIQVLDVKAYKDQLYWQASLGN